MEVYKFLPKVRGGAQRAEGSVVEGKLPILLPNCLYYALQGGGKDRKAGLKEKDHAVIACWSLTPAAG